MPIGGDISHNKCDECNSSLVFNEFGDGSSDESQLEEVCEECEVNKLESRAKIGTKVHNFLEKLKQNKRGIK